MVIIHPTVINATQTAQAASLKPHAKTGVETSSPTPTAKTNFLISCITLTFLGSGLQFDIKLSEIRHPAASDITQTKHPTSTYPHVKTGVEINNEAPTAMAMFFSIILP